MQFFAWCMVAAGIGMGLGSFGTGIGQGLAVKSAVEGVARNPGASGKIMTIMLIGLAMIESLAIYVFVVAMIILFANPFTAQVMQLAAAPQVTERAGRRAKRQKGRGRLAAPLLSFPGPLPSGPCGGCA